MGLDVITSPNLYRINAVSSGAGKDRANVIMKSYMNDEIKLIFDISGGDIANEVLPYLDYSIIAKSNTIYVGYSDLTTIVNSIYKMTGNRGYLYNVRNLIGSNSKVQQEQFYNTFFKGKDELYNFEYEFIRGNELEGEIVGGNMRCLLKLAGTPYMPDFKDKILFLESMGGEAAQMITFLNQYKQMGILDMVKGIVLGTFIKMEQIDAKPNIVELLKDVIREDIPVVTTKQIGHRDDSKCLVIGGYISITRLR